jgi:hypothetical protein
MKHYNLSIMEKEKKGLTRQTVLALLGFILFVNVAKATPSTIIWIPSVDFQGFKSWHLGMDNYIRMQKINGVRGAGIYDLGITTGILPFKNFQAEVGVDYLSMGDNVYDDHPIYFNGKVGFVEGGLFKGSPAVAVGAYNVGLKTNLTNYNILYGIIGKTIPVIGRISAGYYTGNKKLLVDEVGAAKQSGVLLSWDRTMTEISDKLWFAVDYQSNKNYLGALNFGFSWSFAKNVSVIFGYDIYNNKKALYNSTNVNANTFTAQLDINI